MRNNPSLSLTACMLVTFVLGSVHAFSVLIVPLETLLSLPRADISLVYSLALVAITMAVLLGYRFYDLVRPWWLVAFACLVAALGLVVAATAKNWGQFCLGYSLLFGFSNGIGYGFTLQLAGRVLPASRGAAMAAVTAAYAIGSVIFAEILALLIRAVSTTSALNAVAAAILVCGLLAAWLLYLSKARYDIDADTAQESRRGGADGITRFWLAYFCSVFAGLMAIGHAAGIALSRGAAVDLAARAAASIGVGSALGGFAAGWLLTRLPMRRLLVGLPLVSTVVLLAISVTETPSLVIVMLSLVGFSYGAVIAVYPVSIAQRFGSRGPRAYGKVFTAWGFAGMLAPWAAGAIFDLQAGYDGAMLVAAVIALMSAAFASTLNLEALR